MKRTSVLWYVLGAVVLILLGFAAGYLLNGGLIGRGGFAMHTVGRGMFMPRVFFGGLFLLGALIRWIGPLAGILALILVLTRRPAPVAAAPAQTAPVVEATPAVPAEAAPATPTKPARTKK
jgi:hypothetical protein